MDQRTSTLSRWMAHHLAEIIEAAEKAEGPEREAKQNKAVQLIAELWERRRSLPGNAYPLRQLEDVIAVLDRLKPDASPFFVRRGNDVEEVLSRVFDSLQVLVIYGAIIAAKAGELPEDMEATRPYLDDEERQVVDAVKGWTKFGDKGKLKYHVLSGSKGEALDIESMRSKVAELSKLDVQTQSIRIVCAEIEGLMETLSELRRILDARVDEVDVGK